MLVRDLTTLAQAAARLGREPVVALDTETTGLDALADRVLLIALSNGAECVLVDVRALDPQGLVDALRPLMEGGPIKVMHHAKFDVRMLMSLGIRVFPLADTFLDELVLENGHPDVGHALADLSARYLGMPLDKSEREGFSHVSTEAFTAAQLEYTRRDVLATYHVFLQQMPRISREGATRVVRLEALAVSAVADMEQRGVLVDSERWREALKSSETERENARTRLAAQLRPVVDVDLLGEVDLNFDSDADVRAALGRLGVTFEGMHIDDLRTTGHPAAVAFADYREATKRVTTYGESFLQHVNPRTGRIHASFRQIGASSGRMSCERPNLQNIPRGSDLRSCIIAPPGRMLITADYAACELRILAHLSRDPVFMGAFERGEDVHAQVATQVFGVPVSKRERPELRERAKAISFGLIYGMGAAGLAAQTGSTHDEAEALLRQYFARFPRIDATLKGLEHAARRQGYAATVLGRRLYMAADEWDRPGSAAARVARNMPIQGTSADITKLAMAFLYRRLDGTGAFLVNAIHDELLVECAAEAVQDIAHAVKEEMERAMQVVVPSVPAAADVRTGTTWQKG